MHLAPGLKIKVFISELLLSVTSFEFIDTTSSINKFHFTSIERV
jgi:hypothetical protein